MRGLRIIVWLILSTLLGSIIATLAQDWTATSRLCTWEDDNLSKFRHNPEFEEQIGEVFELDVSATLSGSAVYMPYNQSQSSRAYSLFTVNEDKRLDHTDGCIVLDTGDEILYRIRLTNISDSSQTIYCLLDFGKQQEVLLGEAKHPPVLYQGTQGGTYLEHAAPEGLADSPNWNPHHFVVSADLLPGEDATLIINTELTRAPKNSWTRAKIPVKMKLLSHVTGTDEELEVEGEIYRLETVSFWARIRYWLITFVIAEPVFLLLFAALIGIPAHTCDSGGEDEY